MNRLNQQRLLMIILIIIPLLAGAQPVKPKRSHPYGSGVYSRGRFSGKQLGQTHMDIIHGNVHAYSGPYEVDLEQLQLDKKTEYSMHPKRAPASIENTLDDSTLKAGSPW